MLKRLALGLCAVFAVVAFAQPVSLAQDAGRIAISIDPENEGPVISRHIFGQFAEHLGEGIYGGVWVGPDSDIPNTRGIRNDVVAALKELKVPNVRWPGGCYADEYHWRDGIGAPEDRVVRTNNNWGGSSEPNTFGTHEFMDFIDQIGSAAFISANVGSGTVQETADWLEYLTAEGTMLARERAANGRPEPYEIPIWGIGNEAWGCGGSMSAQFYLDNLKMFARASRNYNPDVDMMRVAVGPTPGHDDYAEVIMKGWAEKVWSWDIEGLSVHFYTTPNGWPPAYKATGFGEQEYADVINKTYEMDGLLKKYSATMDKYDPEKKIALMVDEWGAWYAPTEGSPEGFLVQQNSQRDALIAAINFNIFARHAERVRGANIAQMANVLQAMIFTEGGKMVLTPTYHAFRLYTPFQDATRVAVAYKAGKYRFKKISLPGVDAMAAKDAEGRIWLAVTNIDPNKPVTIEAALAGLRVGAAEGETLHAPSIDAVNTFEDPDTVAPKPLSVTVEDGVARFEAAPESVTVLSLSPL